MVSYKAAIGPVFTVTRFFGLLPYGFPSGDLPKAKRLLSLGVNLISIGVGIFFFSRDIHDEVWLNMGFFRFMRRLSGRLWFIMAVMTHVFWQLRRPEKMQKILKKLEMLTFVIGSRHFTFYNVPILIFGLITFGIILPAVVVARGTSPLDVLGSLVVPHVHNVLFLSQFFTFMEMINCNFRRLNQLTGTALDLEACTRVHAELCDLTKEVNQLYTVELLMSFASWVANLITQWFQLYESITKTQLDNSFFLTLPWIVGYRWVQMWSLCHICYEVHYQSDSFSDDLGYAMRRKYPPSNNRKLILYMTKRPSARISCFHLFKIDTGIVATILGTTVTYFIVLVQLN